MQTTGGRCGRQRIGCEVASDLENESKLMEEYSMWCDEEANTKEDAITSSKRTIGDLPELGGVHVSLRAEAE